MEMLTTAIDRFEAAMERLERAAERAERRDAARLDGAETQRAMIERLRAENARLRGFDAPEQEALGQETAADDAPPQQASAQDAPEAAVQATAKRPDEIAPNDAAREEPEVELLHAEEVDHGPFANTAERRFA